MRLIFVTLGLFVLPPLVAAHHSTVGAFDREITDEIEGEITRVLWRNPHVRFTVNVGQDEWEIETGSPSGLRQKNISQVLLEVGDIVRVAGFPSRQSRYALWATHLLLEGEQEIVLNSTKEPRWSDEALGNTGPDFATAGDGSEPELGIYRVWSSTAATPMLFPENVDRDFDLNSYPLTDRAQRAIAAFNPETDSPTTNCAPKGMPTIMEQPYPMEILQRSEDIVLRLEEYDLVRTVHMDSNEASDETPVSSLGYSVGRWEEDILLVTTTRIDWGHFDGIGIPLSEDARIVEHFAPSENGSRMDYRMIVTDLSTFTEPVELLKHWFYVPGVTVERFECTIG
jgi:hypothetical protein